MEAVHVELPDEGRHVGVLVVVGEHLLGELELVPEEGVEDEVWDEDGDEDKDDGEQDEDGEEGTV